MEFLISYGPLILIVTGTIFTSILTKDYRHKIKDEQNKIIELTDEVKDKSSLNQKLNERILGLSEEIKSVSQDNQELTKKNLLLSEETIKLSKKISNQQTGGNSYCFLLAKFQGYPENMRELLLMHEGDYVLKNVSINIVDHYKRKKLLKSYGYNYDEIKQLLDSFSSGSKKMKKELTLKIASWVQSWSGVGYKNYSIGNLAPNRVRVIDKIDLDEDQNEVYWTATIFTENGTFTQKMKFINIKGDTSRAIEVRDSEGKILMKAISDDFPKNEDGTVKWNDN